MNRTERFDKIELLLKNRGIVGFAALIEELGVSPATLKRDLQYLRDRLAGLDDDGVLARHLQPLMERLQGMLGTDAAQAQAHSLMRRVEVVGAARWRVPSRHFELLGSALLQRKRAWLRYLKRSDRSTSEREVSPQRLVNSRSTWCLDAWRHASESLRRFALDALVEAHALDPKAKSVALRDLEAALDAGCGIGGGAGTKVKWATLVFNAAAAQWVANEEWHPEQKSRWLDDDGANAASTGGGRYELQGPHPTANRPNWRWTSCATATA